MSIGTAPVADATEVAMLAALAGILTRGAFATDDLDALVAAKNDITADAAVRDFARRSIAWLAQQSGQRDLQTCNRSHDVWH